MRGYERIENGKNRVTLHLNESLHFHIRKDPAYVYASSLHAKQRISHAVHISIMFSGTRTGMRMIARIPLREGIIVSVSSSLDEKNATRTLTGSWDYSVSYYLSSIMRTGLEVEILQWAFTNHQGQKLHTCVITFRRPFGRQMNAHLYS
jgi:hypothetical protein